MLFTHENYFVEHRRNLAELMSEISEDCYCAGWIIDNEYGIWEAMYTGNLHYGRDEIDRFKLERCRALSVLTGGWVVWLDDETIPKKSLSDAGKYFASMEDWLMLYRERLKSTKN